MMTIQHRGCCYSLLQLRETYCIPKLRFIQDSAQKDRLNDGKQQSHYDETRAEVTNPCLCLARTASGRLDEHFAVVTTFVRPSPVEMNPECDQQH
jgi:hypothetical protein